MKIGPVFLFCVSVAIAAAPVCKADRIPYPQTAKNSPALGTAAKLDGNSGVKMDARVNAGFPGDRDATVKLDNDATKNNASEGGKSEASLVRHDSFADFSEGAATSSNPSKIDTSELASSFTHEGNEWPSLKLQTTTRTRVQDSSATSPAPESGTLAFLLIGMVAIGLVARRRSDWTNTI